MSESEETELLHDNYDAAVEAADQADRAARELQDTPVSHLRNAVQILIMAGPNWLRPVDAFAVRERIEAALAQLEEAE